MNTTIGRPGRLAISVVLAAALPLLAIAPAEAGSNMAKVDIVTEGIDLTPIYVGANASGYTGTEAKAHKFMVRVFAKAAGQNKVWKVKVHSTSGPLVMFEKDVGKTDGWDVYSKSHEVHAKPQNLQWGTFPVDKCRQNMEQMIASGKTKAQVLANDRKVTATTFIGFTAWADSKANNKKGKHKGDGAEAHHFNVAYPVQVVCRAAL